MPETMVETVLTEPEMLENLLVSVRHIEYFLGFFFVCVVVRMLWWFFAGVLFKGV